ncbi:MAG: cytochrome c [Candidatus Paracaedibacteraceae bacterium]|nr:cytochrome c [Candidatus Paracaedibacteraceae bacterium]
MIFPLNSAVAKRIFVVGVVLPFALPVAAVQAQDRQWGSGKNVYEKVCAHCHSPAVGVGPLIGGRGLPEAYIKAIVRNGFNAMPAFPASHIDDESIAELTKYLSTLPPPAVQP